MHLNMALNSLAHMFRLNKEDNMKSRMLKLDASDKEVYDYFKQKATEEKAQKAKDKKANKPKK